MTLLPPGPRGVPLLGSARELLRDPLEFLSQITRAHGDVVRFRLPGQNIYLFNHPSAIEEILKGQHEHVIKDEFTRHLSIVGGNGLLTSEGSFWKRQRRLAQPAFHQQRVQSYAQVMVRHAERCAARFTHGETRDIHQDMMRLTLDIVAETLFGTDVTDSATTIRAALDAAMDHFSGYGVLIPLAVPTPANRRFRRAMRELDAVIYRIIREHREAGDRGDLVSLLLAAKSDEGAMSDAQVRDEIVTLTLAGHETAALTLSFALHAIARHPRVAAALLEEIQRVLADRSPTAADVPLLPYTRAVVRETLRLYPPAWAIGRETTSPVRIAGHDVPAGTQLWAAQWVVHRDARYFPNPERFEPERWTPAFENELPRFAYFPFGGGPRVCIGNAFAMMEAVLLLAVLVQHVRVSSTSNQELRFSPSITLRPRDGVFLHVEPRDARQAA